MEKTIPVDKLETQILRILDAYRAAVLAKDPGAFTALYDPDVCVFDIWSKWSYDGMGAWEAMAESWFGSLGSEQVIVEAENIRIVATPEVATLHALVTYRCLSADGRELQVIPNRLTWVLRRQNDIWNIVHEHTSAPVDFETGKIILRR